jgi:starvation-inducible DNA-binding protein
MAAKPVQPFGEMEQNPIGLPSEAAATLVRALNEDLASAYTLYHLYKKYHWVVTGPEFRDLHLFLDDQAKGALLASDLLAERITALGGVPLSSPMAQEKGAGFAFEPEGVYPVRTMFENALSCEQVLVKRLRPHVAEAMRLQDFGTQDLLMDLLREAEDRAHHLDHFLQRNGLSLEALPVDARSKEPR